MGVILVVPPLVSPDTLPPARGCDVIIALFDLTPPDRSHHYQIIYEIQEDCRFYIISKNSQAFSDDFPMVIQ